MMYNELQTILKDNSSNNGKGRLLECTVKTTIHNLGYTVDVHHITSGGLDIVGTKGNETVIAECINWYGGYIHPKRFLSIIKNLAQPATHKFFFCCGSYPTKKQCRVLRAMNVNIIHLEEQILRIDYRIIQQLRSQLLGVITTVNITDCLVNKECKKVKKDSKSSKPEELETYFEETRELRKRFKQFLDKMLALVSKGHGRFERVRRAKTHSDKQKLTNTSKECKPTNSNRNIGSLRFLLNDRLRFTKKLVPVQVLLFNTLAFNNLDRSKMSYDLFSKLTRKSLAHNTRGNNL